MLGGEGSTAADRTPKLLRCCSTMREQDLGVGGNPLEFGSCYSTRRCLGVGLFRRPTLSGRQFPSKAQNMQDIVSKQVPREKTDKDFHKRVAKNLTIGKSAFWAISLLWFLQVNWNPFRFVKFNKMDCYAFWHLQLHPIQQIVHVIHTLQRTDSEPPLKTTDFKTCQTTIWSPNLSSIFRELNFKCHFANT